MFKKFLIGSITLHLLFMAGLEINLFNSCDLQAAKRSSRIIDVTLEPDSQAEMPVIFKDEATGENSKKEMSIRPERSSFIAPQERILGLSAAEETPPAALTDFKDYGKDNPSSQPETYEVGLKTTTNGESSCLAEMETISPAGNLLSAGPAPQPARLPVKVYAPSPGYPLKARQNNWEGVTILEIGIKADGLIGEVKVLQSSGYLLLDQTAVKTVKKWRYRPALKNGIAITWKLRVRVKFMLEG